MVFYVREVAKTSYTRPGPKMARNHVLRGFYTRHKEAIRFGEIRGARGRYMRSFRNVWGHRDAIHAVSETSRVIGTLFTLFPIRLGPSGRYLRCFRNVWVHRDAIYTVSETCGVLRTLFTLFPKRLGQSGRYLHCFRNVWAHRGGIYVVSETSGPVGTLFTLFPKRPGRPQNQLHTTWTKNGLKLRFKRLLHTT